MRRLVLTAAALALGATLASAQAVQVDSSIAVYQKTSGVSGNINSVGSDTMNNMMALWAETFRKMYPNVKIQIEGKGSGTAPPALIAGTSQFGPMSRPMKASEIDQFEAKYGYKPTQIRTSYDALAVYVSKDNPLEKLTLQQVDAVFSKTRRRGGKDVKTWGDLGLTGDWAARPVSIYGRNSASGTYGFFKEHVLQTGDYGQAWTASTQSWAMSRFAPFTFTSLAVIDDVLYGCNGQGVFALDGDTETMTAELRTGAMDMTGGVLAHPLEAHIEYELRGTATFDVTTTQSGTPVTYSYPLNARPAANALTNARAVFGRGLRGRHFAYTLRLTGQQAYINDWSVLVAPSKRSI